MALSIREIKKSDNQALARIIRTVMPEYDCVGEGYSINDPEVDNMYQAYEADNAIYLVVENEHGKVMGGGGIAPLEQGAATVCELKKMYFLSDIRGQKMGYKVLQLLLENAVKKGYTQCYLETVSQMNAAAKLYRKCGFQPLSAPLGNTGHTACDRYYLKNLIAP